MGNTYSASTRTTMATAAMAKYMNVTKPQIVAIRNAIIPMADIDTGLVRREHLEFALSQAKIEKELDCAVLCHLFTMWDEDGRNRVPCAEFIVSISVLACKEDGIEQAFRFALTVADRNKSGLISAADAHTFLNSICTTASYFGDELLTATQLYKVIDNVFDTMTLIEQEAEDLTHDEFVTLLSEEKHVRELILVEKKKKYNSTSENISSATNSSESNSIAGTASADSFDVPVPTKGKRTKHKKHSGRSQSGKRGHWTARNILSRRPAKQEDWVDRPMSAPVLGERDRRNNLATVGHVTREKADTTKSLLSSGSEQPAVVKKPLRSALKNASPGPFISDTKRNQETTGSYSVSFDSPTGYVDDHAYYSDYTSHMSYKLTPLTRLEIAPE